MTTFALLNGCAQPYSECMWSIGGFYSYFQEYYETTYEHKSTNGSILWFFYPKDLIIKIAWNVFFIGVMHECCASKTLKRNSFIKIKFSFSQTLIYSD
jgi:hypothetical protein